MSTCLLTMRLFVLLVCACAVRGYNILCVFPVPSPSHDFFARGVVEALLDAGHRVTWFTPYTEKPPHENLTLIDGSDVQNINIIPRNANAANVRLWPNGHNMSVAVVRTEELRHALKTQKYDAVVTEWFFSDLLAGIAAVQRAPWVLFSSTTMHPYLEFLVDDLRSLSTIPVMIHPTAIPMSFWERIVNIWYTVQLVYFPLRSDNSRDTEVYSSLYSGLSDSPLPAYDAVRHNVSVLLVNSPPLFAPAQSLPPNVVDVSGFHIVERAPVLPQALQKLMDSSTEGVIYFSMGSIIRESRFTPEMRKHLVQLFSELKQTVLWKFSEPLEGLSNNVYIARWLPQTAILAHPNTRLFISHCGLLSTLEALHYGVPLLAVPVFGDQPGNAVRARIAGVARVAPFGDGFVELVREFVGEMLTNQSYYNKMKQLSRVFRHRLVSPRRLISHHVELAILTKGAPHLRSPALLYSWYQRWMLDIIALIVLILLTIFVTLYLIIKFIIVHLIEYKIKGKLKKNN